MMMNDNFKELIDEGVVMIYMDDILIFGGRMKEQHHTIIVKVLDILSEAQNIPQSGEMYL